MNKLETEVLNIVTNEAIETMAKVNNTTIETVKLAIDSANKNACNQFRQLVLTGWNEAQSTINNMQ